VKYKIITLDKVDSTQTYAKTHKDDFKPDEITLITAEEQTIGYGRQGKTWYSPNRKNIYATFCFKLEKDQNNLTALCHLMTLSLCTVLSNYDLCPHIKWPNDVFLSEKKLSGTLCETVQEKDHIDTYLGIGINVNMTTEDFAKMDPQTNPTSLHFETGKTFDRQKLLDELQKTFLENLTVFKKEGFCPFHNEFDSLLLYKGQKVCVDTGKTQITGTLHSTTVDGALNLFLDTKDMACVTCGSLKKL